jgi:transketolase
VKARVSIEAAATMGWSQWVGDAGASRGMTGFGASGPAKELFEHFGLTAGHLAEVARRTHSSIQEA